LDANNFAECNIRFEEDEFVDGKKLSALDFCSLRYFYQFVFDRFHSHSQFLLDTSLPMYSEWKKMRKVTFRNNDLKKVDYALKECIKCVDSIKALVRNTIIMNYDEEQEIKQAVFKECVHVKPPLKIKETTFNNGNFSIMAAWDLFDNGSTASANDWNAALNAEHGAAQKLALSAPDLSHVSGDELSLSTVFHECQTYKYHILSEFVNQNGDYLKFGAGPIEWKLIKSKFLQQHGMEYRNQILKGYDNLYHINPPLRKLNELMSDRNDRYVSKRRIIAEPMMWLFYMVSLLIERQEKLQSLYITAMSFKGDNNNKGQKLTGNITNLAKQAKDESERLRAITAKLPQSNDLKQTLIDMVKKRDPENKKEYTQSLSYYQF